MNKTTIKKVFVISTLSLAILMSFLPTLSADGAEPHTADAIWIEPSTLSFYTYATSVGDKFNVTLWVNLTGDSFLWQFHLNFNKTQLNATRAGYTGSVSDWATHRTGGGTVPVVPLIDNDIGYVEHGESCSGVDYVPGPVVASLAWTEFEILTAPVEGNLTSQLGINNTDTFVLDYELDEIPLTKYDADYSYTFAEDNTPPTIDTPVQNPPSDNVQPNQNVTVSVNVTDTESGVKNVTLLYTNDTTVWHSIPMSLNETSGLWEGLIPGEPLDTYVQYKIVAYDNSEISETNDNSGDYFVYTVIPEFTPIMLLTLMVLSTISLIVVRKKLKKT
jgi:hypothetical protein